MTTTKILKYMLAPDELECLIDAAMRNGDHLNIGNTFTDSPKRNFASLHFDYLSLGDVITFPNVYQVNSTIVIPERPQLKMSASYVRPYREPVSKEYIFVKTHAGHARKFFPATFLKQGDLFTEPTIYGKESQPTGERICTKGTATEFFKSFDNINEAMNALKGRTIKVTNEEVFPTRPYMGYHRATIYTIDFIDE